MSPVQETLTKLLYNSLTSSGYTSYISLSANLLCVGFISIKIKTITIIKATKTCIKFLFTPKNFFIFPIYPYLV